MANLTADLVSRLRIKAQIGGVVPINDVTLLEAAKTVEALRVALREISIGWSRPAPELAEIARRALSDDYLALILRSPEPSIEEQVDIEKKALANLLDAVEGVLGISWHDRNLDVEAGRTIDLLRCTTNDYGVIQRVKNG